MVMKKDGNAGTATVKGYSIGDIQPNVSGSKEVIVQIGIGGMLAIGIIKRTREFVAANNKSFIVDKQGHNGKKSVDYGKKEEKGKKGSQKENNFGNTVNRFAERFYSYVVAILVLLGSQLMVNGSMPPVLRTQKHGVEEWNSLKKVRV
ncbi:unnamed protein product [Lactuca saligna]|uniref:Uncharacterized protein n=1 Tax=Lactuca saligna TaxID=75948 RepID=A0AA35VJ92_LACSI|nr:unnamed protein product [Lactuca saligna]